MLAVRARRLLLADTAGLLSTDQIRRNPVECRARYAERMTETKKQCNDVDRVEGGRQVELKQNGSITVVGRTLHIIHHSEQRRFRLMTAPVRCLITISSRGHCT